MPVPPTCRLHARACACRDRISSSLTLYELGRRFWQHQDYERSLVAVEQAISLKLFPYEDRAQLERWQRGLLSPGYMFKRPKLELADALILKANCMYELGRRGRSMEYLYQALEAVHLAAAFMHCSMVSDGGLCQSSGGSQAASVHQSARGARASHALLFAAGAAQLQGCSHGARWRSMVTRRWRCPTCGHVTWHWGHAVFATRIESAPPCLRLPACAGLGARGAGALRDADAAHQPRGS